MIQGLLCWPLIEEDNKEDDDDDVVFVEASDEEGRGGELATKAKQDSLGVSKSNSQKADIRN